MEKEMRGLPASLVGLAAVAAVYVGAAKVGLALSVAYGNVTPVWAPTGISLAVLILFGYRFWPGIAIGALIANLTTPIPPLAAFGICIGNTLEALIGAYLLQRFGGFRRQLDRVRDVLALLLLGAVISTCISATIGTASLWLAGEIPLARYGFAWRLWWLGDAMGVLLVAPLILTWLGELQPGHRSPRRPKEQIALLALLVAVSWIVFFGGRWRYPYLLFPILVWEALRFRQRGASRAIFVMAALGVAGTLDGSVPIGGATLTESVQILQILMGILAVTALILAATITERERSEQSLEASLSLLRATLDSTADGILVVDPGGRVVTSNKRFADMWRIPEELLRSGDDDRLQAFVLDQLVEPDAFLSRVRGIYAHPEAESHDVLNFKDGRVFERYSQPERGGREGPRRVWSFRDVTEKTKAEQEAQRLTQIREEFIANAAHELRTPVIAMYGVSYFMSQNSATMSKEQTDACIDSLTRQAERLRNLVNNLLDLTALREGKLRIEPRPVAISVLVKEVLEALPTPEGKRVDSTVDDEIAVLADPHRLHQMLSNLLGNAYRYGGNSIRLDAQAQDGRVFVIVEDDGPGVPEELVPTLFDTFSRGSNSANSIGSGLGLAIVRTLAQASGAEISYEPGEGRGARFVLNLPGVSS